MDEIFEASVSNSPNPDDNFQTNKSRWLEEAGLNENELAFIPFTGRYGNSILILDRKGELLDSITAK